MESIQMQSNLQDLAPRRMKLIIRKPVDKSKVDKEAASDGSTKQSAKAAASVGDLIQTQPNLDVASSMVEKERSRFPRLMKKRHKRLPDNTEVDARTGGDESIGSTSNQLVLYNPGSNNTMEGMLPVSDHGESYTSYLQNLMALNPATRILPSVGTFTVQCADCFKWRVIPTKELYEEIREHVLEIPFTCDRARAWRPDITCDDPADISQDGSRLWAIDKPNIAQPPSGWERQLRIRGEGSTRFADVYYVSPSGKRLRSMVEVQNYLLKHPEYIEQGVNLSQFSFQIPRPLQENYVRKRPARMPNPLDGAFGLPRPLEPDEVDPLSWAEPAEEVHIDPYNEDQVYDRPPFETPSPPPAPSPSPTPTPSPHEKKASKPRIFIKNSNSSRTSVIKSATEEPRSFL